MRTPTRLKVERAVVREGYLGLGSNVGDSAGHLRAAVELLEQRGIEVEALSSTYMTEPVGEILDQPDFLNAAIRIRTELEPEALLDACKAVEAERGRAFDLPRHSPRPLDVDLLLLGEIELRTERLTLPHPEVSSRRFVLAPLLELDPELALPDGTRLAESLAALRKGQRVDRAGELRSLEKGRLERSSSLVDDQDSNARRADGGERTRGPH
jgi:2-amino-4-hydroxy-6-hydroxymethyldihydropteridine diphosphokinase